MAISTITPTAPVAYALGDHFRALGIPVVMGGPHLTFLPKEALQHADYCILGEEEVSFPRLLDALVWAIVTMDVALLRKESASLLVRRDLEPSEQ